MNVMAQAHKDTRNHIALSSASFHYGKLFAFYLKRAHKEYKAMQAQSPVELLKADTIAKFEQRLVELKAILNGPDAQKYIVVCGDEHPMPVDFEATDPKWPWSNVEGATKWHSRQFAEANARKVVNGNQQAGKAVRVDHHVEWDMQNLCKLINDLKA